jgi:lipoprotein-anchoring transpeptidase ErfK/SrfK
MTSRNTASHQRSSRAFWLIFLVSACLLVMLAGVTLAAAPYVGLATVKAPPTSRPITWGPARIAKPTYTPSPVPTSTPLPTETPVPTVVVDTRLPADSSELSMSYADTGQQEAPAPYTGGKSILVSISEQHMYAYDNGQLVFSFIASTGMRSSTRIGNFSVLDKIPNAYGSTWNIWMPNWMGIYYSGTLENGIHALPILPSGAQLWAGFLGTPISYGCVVLGADESLELFNWADIGTPVDIQW